MPDESSFQDIDQYVEGQKIPRWVRGTPEPDSYGLVMHASGGDQMEGLCLTREEYKMLKRHLAVFRGYPANVIKVEEDN